MNKFKKKSKVKILLVLLALIALSWLAIYCFFMVSPTVALASCADNSGLWDEKEKKCYCEQERGDEREICIANLAEELKSVN